MGNCLTAGRVKVCARQSTGCAIPVGNGFGLISRAGLPERRKCRAGHQQLDAAHGVVGVFRIGSRQV